jgi:hypothetical protein
MSGGWALLGAVLGIGLSTGLSGDARSDVVGESTWSASHAAWDEIQWPFLIDEWGQGRVFVCHAGDCGSEMSLYLRVKVGFCSCATGVTDDDDVDRIGDLRLLSERFAGLAGGHAVEVDGMSGRSRSYTVSLPLARTQTAVAIVLHARCDAVVATVAAAPNQLAAAESYALGFLGSDRARGWVKTASGS